MNSGPKKNKKGLQWQPIGPGKYRATLIESRITINSVRFRLIGYRVLMPYSAGWSRFPYWEDDKSLQRLGLLWGVESYKKYVRKLDNMPPDFEGDVDWHIPAMTPEMKRVEEAWNQISSYLSWEDSLWRPAIVDGSPYIIVGYPVKADGPSDIELCFSDTKTGLSVEEGQHHFPLDIEGAACGLIAAEVRSITAENKTVLRPMHKPSNGLLGLFEEIYKLLPDIHERSFLTVDGKLLSGLIVPMDLEDWSFDLTNFVLEHKDSIPDGHMHWISTLPIGNVKDSTKECVRALCKKVVRRDVSRLPARSGNRTVFVTFCHDEETRIIGRHASIELRAEAWAEIGQMALRHLTKKEDGSIEIGVGRVLSEVFILPGETYIGLTPEFMNFADAVSDAGYDVTVSTPCLSGIERMPEWSEGNLPILFDRHIQKALSDIPDIVR